MKAGAYFTSILPRAPEFWLARLGLIRPRGPITLTYSVTAACQSLCKTCMIGERYLKNPKRSDQNLSLDEVEEIFRTLGKIYFLNISGGEPFLRDDLPQIIDLACRYLQPKLIHIPTNALAPARSRKLTEQLLRVIATHDPGIPISIKPSIDGIGDKHDAIRGVKGGFNKLLATVKGLKELEERYPNLHVELGTVVSTENIEDLAEIEQFVHGLGIESYRNEIAEHRTEFFNQDVTITPDAATYEHLMRSFSRRIAKNIGKKRLLTRTLEAIRLEYYDLAVRILHEQRQVIPCLAGISNVHINYDGSLWPCCVLGYDKPMGDLREAGLDFQKVYHSEQAKQVRAHIAAKKCVCPLANQAFSNILFHPPSLLRSGLRAARFLLATGR